jgi:glycosyltransferase involved in cell wall biosynthesis
MAIGMDPAAASACQTPRTTVIITSFNYAEYLRQAIDSVLAQTDTDFELLIVDDGSTDESAAHARSYVDPRIQVVVQPHRGTGAARNAGLRAARGRYVAFLDADDIWMPGKLAAQCAVLDRRADIGLVYARFGVIDADRRVLSSGRSFFGAKPSGTIFRHLLTGNVIGTPSTICFRRDMVADGQLAFDETGAYTEDWHFYLRTALRTRIHYLPRTLAYHRQHSRNMGGHVPTIMKEILHTGRFGLELARERLEVTESELKHLERRVLAYAEAIAGREYVKAGNWALARAHAARSLMLQPWNMRETVLYLLASMGWVPGVVTRHLK